MKRSAVFLLFLTALLPLLAQQREEFLTWDDFVTEFRESFYGEDDNGLTAEEADGYATELLQALADIHTSPFNINNVSREELLLLPFLDETKVDSLLSYRDTQLAHKHHIWSLGELMYIHPLTHTDRRWLSLFCYAGDIVKTESLHDIIRQGHHTIDSRLDLPLYWRQGNAAHTKAEAAEHPNKYYEGYRPAATLRYRYESGHRLQWGATLQKDSNEPFAAHHTYPFDYNSAYFAYRAKRWNITLGDYNLHYGQGLIVGSTTYASRQMMATSLPRAGIDLRPHTSTEEFYFFRGAAGGAQVKVGKQVLSVNAFLSYRRLDGRLANDTITSFLTSGQHRTLTEIDRRNAVGNITGGGRIALDARHWQVGVQGVWSHYDHVIWPAVKEYNRFYLRGKDAAGMSADYRVKQNRWSMQGEMALDRQGHFATVNSVRWTPLAECGITAQVRWLTPQYVSPWGRTLSQSSHLQNEQALLLAANWTPSYRQEWTAYVEAFRLPRTSFRADSTALGIETFLQGRFRVTNKWTLTARYKMKTRQYNVTGYDVLEYVQTHRVTSMVNYATERWSCTLTATGALYKKQTVAQPSFGGAVGIRGSWMPLKQLKIQAFSAIFGTDDYYTRVYIYMPQLAHLATGIPSLYYSGVTSSLTAEWKVAQWLEVGMRYALVHYLHNRHVGSGAAQLLSPTRNDISVHARLNF